MHHLGPQGSCLVPYALYIFDVSCQGLKFFSTSSTLFIIGFMSKFSLVEASLSSIRSLWLRRTHLLHISRRFLLTSLIPKVANSLLWVHFAVKCIESPEETHRNTASTWGYGLSASLTAWLPSLWKGQNTSAFLHFVENLIPLMQ